LHKKTGRLESNKM